MNKTAIKNFSVWAREKLIDDIKNAAMQKGISAEGIAKPLAGSSLDMQLFDIGLKDNVILRGKEITQRNDLAEAIRRKAVGSDYETAFNAVMEEIAYTWFNRLIAIRFMEVNDYLPSRVRVISSEISAKAEPDLVTSPFDSDLDFTEEEQDKILDMRDKNDLKGLFNLLFIKQCNKLHEVLPRLFEKTNDYTELLLNIDFTDKDGIIYHLVHDIDEDDWRDQVQIIGWLYQYYNSEAKDKVFTDLKKNIKITKENIPAATQLFTPDWIVHYMVENSLGRIIINVECGESNDEKERICKEKEIADRFGWRYYIPEAEQTEEVRKQLNADVSELKNDFRIEDLKVIDPCMGSGHILDYAFDVFMQIYEAYGYTSREAVRSIIENNLFGLDIDKRAEQLAYFSVMMKAQEYDRRALRRGYDPYVYAVRASNWLSKQWTANNEQMQKLFDCMKDADEYGSLVVVPEMDFDSLLDFVNNGLYEEGSSSQIDFSSHIMSNQKQEVLNLINTAKNLSQKYSVVVTNPPYMAVSNVNNVMQSFVKKNYPDSKSDLFAAFIERCEIMTSKKGYQAMITQHAWMFLSSYEKLRVKLLQKDTVNMAHLGARAFEEISGEVVQTTSFVMRNSYLPDYKGIYCRLIKPTNQQEKEDMFLAGEGCYFAQQSNFSKIHGSPIAYWVNEAVFNAYDKGILLGDISTVSEGIKTGDNNRFLRLWYEVSSTKFSFATVDIGYKWYPHHKGGEYRKWYGNRDWVINWEYDGKEIKNSQNSGLQGKTMYFGIFSSWSKISSKGNPLRYYSGHCLFDSGAPAISNDKLFLTTALFNTKVGAYFLSAISPTLNLQVGDVKSVPLLTDRAEEIEPIVEKNIKLSQIDWDSFETSWDFKIHPLVKFMGYAAWPEAGEKFEDNGSVESGFDSWAAHAEYRFNKLKANEEELNRIFIDIYGLQDELTPEVEDKDVTVRKADLQRDIRSLLSYAVGCMFGRYSLDVEGLAYAGGDWDSSKYISFVPVKDNAIPITDEPYLQNDIVSLFCDWLKKVYGADTLEKNLSFIAKALGNKGNTSRQVIRNYFLNDFIKDHIKIYQKRPIYWLFDSGKKNGFKCLVYMHRWNADTAGKVRVDYLHKLQHIYEFEIQRMQETIDDTKNPREATKAAKRKDKLQKQLNETKEYDTRLAHIALSRPTIDLDDGVKVNYEKVQTSRDGKNMKILAKI